MAAIIFTMKKDDLNRRCAEMKERMLAQKAASAMNQPLRPPPLRSSEGEPDNRVERTTANSEMATLSEMAALKQRIARLEA